MDVPLVNSVSQRIKPKDVVYQIRNKGAVSINFDNAQFSVGIELGQIDLLSKNMPK